MKITGYEVICNTGNNIDETYNNVINGNINFFDNLSCFKENGFVRAGLIKTDLPSVSDTDFNLRCNRLLLKTCELLKKQISDLLNKYPKNKIGIIVATTNTGVEEFSTTRNKQHSELGNPAYFLKEQFKTEGYYMAVSTACSSGIKAFSIARDLIDNNICEALIIGCVDTLAKVPVYGFSSLEALAEKPSIPFSKNRSGMNIGEACSIFLIEKEVKGGIEIKGLGESSDIYHSTTPDPEAKEEIIAIYSALNDAKLTPEDIDYINAHGTGTVANDIMEANAIYKVFKDKVPVSSTKPITGHCLGAAAGIETALCCKLIDNFQGELYPHIFDENYDESLPEINLVKKGKKYKQCNICMCNSFGFGGTNAIVILGKSNE